MTPRTLAEVERALREIAMLRLCDHDRTLPYNCNNGCYEPDYPALAAQVWAWLEEKDRVIAVDGETLREAVRRAKKP